MTDSALVLIAFWAERLLRGLPYRCSVVRLEPGEPTLIGGCPTGRDVRAGRS